ncbi:MAG: M28 family peptidase [Deltaproteobacteria bacterium]|nr:MAG: M28 family peptidase [Deltaproteobacteria bacterium]
MTAMPNSSYSGPFHPLTDLEQQLRGNLRQHVFFIAEKIGERNVWHPQQLEKTAVYIHEMLKSNGFHVFTQTYPAQGITVKNLEAEQRGSSIPEEIVIIGAHYDSVIGSPGANDNASGIGCILEVARLIAGQKLKRTVRVVAFVNEEPPFFQTSLMGSRVSASRSRQRNEKIVAMLSIETIGYYSDTPGSQHYPFPFSFFYPNTGNFIGFVGNLASRKLLRKVMASFRRHTAFPSEGVAAPGWITGIGWSDQWSFWKEGYPGVMVTDTAPYRYPFYHTMQDTPDKIKHDHLARVVAGIAKVVIEISELEANP